MIQACINLFQFKSQKSLKDKNTCIKSLQQSTINPSISICLLQHFTRFPQFSGPDQSFVKERNEQAWVPQQNTDKKQCQLVLTEDKNQLRDFFFPFSSLVEDFRKSITSVNKTEGKKHYISQQLIYASYVAFIEYFCFEWFVEVPYAVNNIFFLTIFSIIG